MPLSTGPQLKAHIARRVQVLLTAALPTWWNGAGVSSVTVTESSDRETLIRVVPDGNDVVRYFLVTVKEMR